MAFALVYTAQPQKISYWKNPGFTHLEEKMFKWAKIDDIDVVAMVENYPTFFRNHKVERLMILNTETGYMKPLSKEDRMATIKYDFTQQYEQISFELVVAPAVSIPPKWLPMVVEQSALPAVIAQPQVIETEEPVENSEEDSLQKFGLSHHYMPLFAKRELLNKSPYVIARVKPGERVKYYSKKQHDFLPDGKSAISHWSNLKDAKQKLAALYQIDEYQGLLEDAYVTIVDGLAGERVLPENDRQEIIALAPTSATEPVSLTAVSESFDPDFEPTVIYQNSYSKTTVGQHFEKQPSAKNLSANGSVEGYLPHYDQQRFSSKAIFDAICLLTDAMKLSSTVSILVDKYDNGLLQDDLHFLEFSDLDQIDADKFVAHLQANRQKRREIKDLQILLKALKDGFKADRVMQKITEQANGRKYYFHSKEESEFLKAITHSKGMA